MTTLRDMLGAEKLTVFCERIGCGHRAPIHIPALAKRFGWDYDLIADRPAFMALLRCSKCNGRDVQIHITPLKTWGGGDGRSS